ncbi:MAG: HDOD domain-containing protein [Epsilonproteobacteria bacterium]|nr:HDOD domain-containing protein [Campylobacterota bacterium]
MAYIPLIARVESLPPLPESVMKIEALFAKGDPDIAELVKIIESDPLLTTDLLAKANAPYYGFSKNIVSVLQVVTLFSATYVRSIVLASSIERSFDVDLSPYDISTTMFSKISSMQSELAFQWYMAVDVDRAKEIMPIAFLMEIGKILIAKDIIENNNTEAFLQDLYTYKDLDYVENKYVMMTTAQINALIFEHLHLNETFAEVMKYLDNDKELPEEIKPYVLPLRVIRTSINFLDQLSDESVEKAVLLLEENQLPTEKFLRAVERIRKKFLDY